MTAKKAATSAKHKTTAKKHGASAKHTETKAQLAHLHVLHLEHKEHLAHMAATGQKVITKAKPAAHAKATKAVSFGVGDWLPVCAFEAVAMSLRLAGQRVHGDDVGELWELCGAREATPVGEALAAAVRFGLAGCRPQKYMQDLPRRNDGSGEEHGASYVIPRADGHGSRANGYHVGRADGPGSGIDYPVLETHALILGVDVPGPHAVLATADGWWSWGELYDPWPCRVDQAWAVSWS